MKQIDKLAAAGGTAFPAETPLVEGGVLHSPGMSLRDWFAGRAMQSLIRADREWDFLAREAYAMADAMLAERSKP